FEHLMFTGSEHYDGEYFEPLTEVGATGMNGTTSTDRTNYYQTVPTRALDRALWLESERMGYFIDAVTED
ncbi:MAG: insulinase family protein, partial [Algiphilus sp.]